MRPAKADSILDPGFQPCNFRSLPFGRCKELMPTYYYIALPHTPRSRTSTLRSRFLVIMLLTLRMLPYMLLLWWYVALASANVCSEIGIAIIRGPRDLTRRPRFSRPPNNH